MVDAASAIALFFASPTVLSLMIILVINLAVVAFIMGKKRFVPTKIFLLNALLWAGMFIDAGLLPSVYAIVFIVSAAGMITYFYGELFGKGQSGYQKMLIQYVVFFGVCLSLETSLLLSSDIFSGNIDFFGIVVSSAPSACDWLNPSTWLNCVFGTVTSLPIIGPIFKFYTISTSIAIFNTILIAPLGWFVSIYVWNWIRGAQ